MHVSVCNLIGVQNGSANYGLEARVLTVFLTCTCSQKEQKACVFHVHEHAVRCLNLLTDVKRSSAPLQSHILFNF